ncbi:MAG TPA: DUF4938 domain-containing protein [Herpetosiphonaceae bacterium]|nr:DUF4938 domain-containing protein [Herpetosiphonaceae bacterium]
MPIEIESVRVLEGPNIHYPQGGVAARLSAGDDIRDELARAIKTWAQSVGLIIGYLRLKAAPAGDRVAIDVSYTCNHPGLGAGLLSGAVADLEAAERGDEDYSHDDALFDLRRRRMREDPTLPLLQLRAEAQGRDLPTLAVGDGTLQIGTGARSWRFDPSGLSLGMSVSPPWAEIGNAPLVAVGGRGARAAAERIAAALGQTVANVAAVPAGGFDAIRGSMLDQSAEAIVVALDDQATLQRGLPFNRCLVGVVLGLDGLPEDEALAAGLPALVADVKGAALLLSTDRRSAALAQRTAAAVISLAPGQPPASAHGAPQAPAASPLVAATIAAVQELLDESVAG